MPSKSPSCSIDLQKVGEEAARVYNLANGAGLSPHDCWRAVGKAALLAMIPAGYQSCMVCAVKSWHCGLSVAQNDGSFLPGPSCPARLQGAPDVAIVRELLSDRRVAFHRRGGGGK